LKEFLFKFKDKITVPEFEEFFENNIEIKLVNISYAKEIINEKQKNNPNIKQTFFINEIASPEMKNKSQYSLKTDIYALGFITLFLITGKFDLNADFKGSPEFYEFILKATHKDERKRSSVDELLQLKFLNVAYNELFVSKEKYKLNEKIELQEIIPEEPKKEEKKENLPNQTTIEEKKEEKKENLQKHETIEEKKEENKEIQPKQDINEEKKDITQNQGIKEEKKDNQQNQVVNEEKKRRKERKSTKSSNQLGKERRNEK